MIVGGEYLIKNDILVQHLGHDKKVSIPSRVDGHDIRGIGKGAFTGKKISTLILSEGIEVVEKGAFEGATINNLILPDSLGVISDTAYTNLHLERVVLFRVFGKADWSHIQSKCILTTTGEYLLKTECVIDEVFNTIINIYDSNNKLPGNIDEDMITLFSASEAREDIVFSDKKIKSRDCMKGYLIRNEILASVSKETDDSDDLVYRNVGSTTIRNVVLCKISLDKGFEDPANVRVKIHFVNGIFYWLRMEKMVFDKKIYYISSKEYLNSSVKVPYIKMLDNVYDDMGFEVNDATSKMVLRKYNLLRSIP